jgi:hypothetical protein
MKSFKQQSRKILRQLHAVKPTDGRQARAHVVRDPNIISNGRIQELEEEALLGYQY